MPKASKGGFYAVKVGKVPGVYNTWDECQAQVVGFLGNRHKKFKTYAEAQSFAFPKGQLAGSSSSVGHSSIVTSAPAAKSVITTKAGPSRKARPPVVKAPITHNAFSSTTPADEAAFDVVAYTDGACKNNQGGGAQKRAGYGVWFGEGDDRNVAERCPGEQTNNRAELLALIRALEVIPHRKHKIILKTDSKYSIDCMEKWVHKWKSNGWKKADGKPVLNEGLVRYLYALLDERAVSGQFVKLQHVAGHAGILGNEAADQLANEGCWLEEAIERDWELLSTDVEARKRDTAERVRGEQTTFEIEEVVILGSTGNHIGKEVAITPL